MNFKGFYFFVLLPRLGPVKPRAGFGLNMAYSMPRAIAPPATYATVLLPPSCSGVGVLGASSVCALVLGTVVPAFGIPVPVPIPKLTEPGIVIVPVLVPELVPVPVPVLVPVPVVVALVSTPARALYLSLIHI